MDLYVAAGWHSNVSCVATLGAARATTLFPNRHLLHLTSTPRKLWERHPNSQTISMAQLHSTTFCHGRGDIRFRFFTAYPHS